MDYYPDPIDAVKAVEALESALQCLREIAAMGKKAGERAQEWLVKHGYEITRGGVNET